MSYLLRVELPDVPGSLGRLASAIGRSGANIDAIEIVGRDSVAGTAIDDVFIAPDAEVMPDSIVSACNSLEGVKVLWISRYAAGGNLFLDLEAVESMTEHPANAIERLVDALPRRSSGPPTWRRVSASTCPRPGPTSWSPARRSTPTSWSWSAGAAARSSSTPRSPGSRT
jgi:hypothetical protein